jgi:competence protein ComEC
LRYSGAAAVVVASLWAIATPLPDILIALDGRAIAARGGDGRLAVIKTGSDSFAVGEWLAADGDARTPGDASLKEGTKCDAAGCVARLKDGGFVALALSPDAFDDDCRRAAVLVTPGKGPSNCAAMINDRDLRMRTGAMALRRTGEGYAVTLTRPPGYDRPWARAAPLLVNDGAASTGPATRDATPRAEDLEPDD